MSQLPSAIEFRSSVNIITASLHQNIPLKSAKDLRMGWTFTFQQDNEPKHTARATMKWFRSKHIHMLESPDLNQLENLWQDLKIAVHRHSPSNQTKLELFCKENGQIFRSLYVHRW